MNGTDLETPISNQGEDGEFKAAMKLLDGLITNDITDFQAINASSSTNNSKEDNNKSKEDATSKDEENKQIGASGSNDNDYSEAINRLLRKTKGEQEDELQQVEQYMGTRKKIFLDSIPKKPRWVWNRAPDLFHNENPLSDLQRFKTGTPAEFVNLSPSKEKQQKKKVSSDNNNKNIAKDAPLESNSANSNNKSNDKNLNTKEKSKESSSIPERKKKVKVSPLYHVSGMDTFLDRCDYANYQRVAKKENFYHIETGYSQNVPTILCKAHDTHSFDEGLEHWNFSIDVENRKATYKPNNAPSTKKELLQSRMTNRSPGCVPKSTKQNPYKLYKDLAKQIAIESILAEQQQAK